MSDDNPNGATFVSPPWLRSRDSRLTDFNAASDVLRRKNARDRRAIAANRAKRAATLPDTARVTVRLAYAGMRVENTVARVDARAKLADMFARHGITPLKSDGMRGRSATGARATASFLPAN